MSSSQKPTGRMAPCPTCKVPASVDRSNAFRPFCSERCRDLDLAGWLDGDYRIPGRPASAWELPLEGRQGEPDDA